MCVYVCRMHYINKAMQYHITLIIALRIHKLFYLKHWFLIYTLVAYGYWMAKLNIAYNNAYRIIMNYRRRNSASLMFLTIMLIM